MALAPASLSISAEMSPVKAPEASAWQSCAPIATGELRARVAKPAMSVAGGQTRRSMRVASAPAPSMMALSSVADCCRPFIFQLPAISGRSALAMPDAMLDALLDLCRFSAENRVAERRDTDQCPVSEARGCACGRSAGRAGTSNRRHKRADHLSLGAHAQAPAVVAAGRRSPYDAARTGRRGRPKTPFAHNTVGSC